MSKKDTRIIGVRVTPAEQAALRQAATREARSLSSLARVILKQWLDKQGEQPSG